MTDILLATYNGEKYIKEQLGSLLAQTCEDWRIIARDDGSTDATPQLLREFSAAHPGKLEIVSDGEKNLGSKGNFARLLTLSRSEYIMFCDQDDVWLPDKIERTLALMRDTEQGRPALVHTDLTVTDKDLNTKDGSFISAHGLDPLPASAAGLMLRNSVTGCTVMINRRLADIAGLLPAECLMHDHCLALLALTFGKMGYLDSPTILYRQHGDNAVGSHKKGFFIKLKRLIDIPGYKAALVRTGAETERNISQAAAIYEKYADLMTGENKRLYKELIDIKSKSRAGRIKTLRRGGYLPKSGYERTATELYYLLVR